MDTLAQSNMHVVSTQLYDDI